MLSSVVRTLRTKYVRNNELAERRNLDESERLMQALKLQFQKLNLIISKKIFSIRLKGRTQFKGEVLVLCPNGNYDSCSNARLVLLCAEMIFLSNIPGVTLLRFMALATFFVWEKHRKSRSSIFLSFSTPRKRLLRRLSYYIWDWPVGSARVSEKKGWIGDWLFERLSGILDSEDNFSQVVERLSSRTCFFCFRTTLAQTITLDELVTGLRTPVWTARDARRLA